MRTTFSKLRKSCEGNSEKMKAFNKLVKSFKDNSQSVYLVSSFKFNDGSVEVTSSKVSDNPEEAKDSKKIIADNSNTGLKYLDQQVVVGDKEKDRLVREWKRKYTTKTIVGVIVDDKNKTGKVVFEPENKMTKEEFIKKYPKAKSVKVVNSPMDAKAYGVSQIDHLLGK